MVHLFFTLVAAVCVLADDAVEDRKTKLPYIADAVGNQIPPPSNGPAPVGSPSNLLTPDRYEFYTFDESGELVKRLMTLDEIQAIVAAGEGTEGHLVTFANDDQPNISFNFSQAPFTKVHNVVTNVQNVLKAQMEAQKNNPPLHTTLDTPDVSDSWSLILPTIFGNTGAEIIPDKSSNVHSIPETDTLELDFDENSLSKEGDSHVLSSSAATSKYEESEITTEKINDEVTELPSSTSEVTTSTTTTTTTPKPTTTSTTTTTTQRPTTTTTTTIKPRTTSTTTVKPRTTSTTTAKPRTTSTTTTTSKPRTTSTTTTTAKPRTTSTTTTTAKPRTTTTTTTTAKPRTTSTTTTTAKPRTTTTTTTTSTAKPPVTTTVTTPKTTTTRKPSTTTSLPKKKPTTTTITTPKPRITTTEKDTESSTTTSPIFTTAKLTTKPFTTPVAAEYSKIETIQHPSIGKNITQEDNTSYVPVSTVSYVTTERSTEKPMELHKTTYFASTTKRSVTSRLTTTASPITTKAQPAITTYKPTKITSSTTNSFISTPALQELEKVDNITTITTQSVSPSTTESSIEFTLINNDKKQDTTEVLNDENEPQIPYFDIAQSFSQIASELDNDPLPTTSTLVDTTKSDGSELESKEDGEMDIHDFNNTETKTTVVVPLNVFPDDSEKFVKISTLDPPMEDKKENEAAIEQSTTTEKNKKNEDNLVSATPSNLGTTIDPILFESMDDLFSQIINQNPQIVQNAEKPIKEDIPAITTTENMKVPTIDNRIKLESVTETLLISKNKTEDKIMNKLNNLIENVKISEVTESNFSTEKVSPTTSEDKKNTEQIFTNNDIESLSTATQSSTTQRTMAIENITQYENDKINKNKIINDTVTGHENIIQTPESSTEKLVLIHDNNLNKKNNSTTTMAIDEQKNKDSNSIAEQNKVQTIQETAKLPNLKPKIDEFKKKIQKVNIDDKELINDRNSSWKLISTVKPPKINEMQKDKINNENNVGAEPEDNKNINLDVSKENQGLAVTTKDLSEDVSQFTELCNELAFRYWHSMTEQIEKRRSFVLSPYSITSMLAMMFMGARGGTSGEMNEILKLDDMVTFNPHFTLKNISDSIETTPESGVIVSAFIRELYSDRNRGKILTFYKERAQHFYNGHVEEINFKLISDIIRRRTNLLVKRYTWGRIQEYMKANSITMEPPLAALSTNIFETDCSGTSVDGRDGEMYFVVSPTVRQRRLVPVPSVVYKKGFLAGYDPALDATAAALGNTNSIVSTLFLMPGQQGNVVHAEDLEALERRLLDSNPTTEVFNRLLRTLLPRMGLELQIPRFSHKSIFNVSSTLKTMGLKELFDSDNADLGGLNGPSKDLYLSDMVQLTTFVTCGEGVIGEQHHIEEYPERIESSRRRRTSRWAAGWDEPRDYQRAFHDPHDVGDAMHLPLHLRPRQARLPSRNAQPARLKFDRPFLFFVRHNPSGMILYVGRYNPRLLP